MGKTTGISWTDSTHNFWYGCQKVSQGCKGCYAEREMTRYGKDFSTVTKAKGFDAPLRWNGPRKVFVNSWSDFFIEEADAWRPLAWEIIRQTPHLTFQILTKRPERMMQHLPWVEPGDSSYDVPPWKNVWLGVSVENQETADERIPWLLKTPAAVRFVSYEPALGAVDFDPWLGANYETNKCRERGIRGSIERRTRDRFPRADLESRSEKRRPLGGISWVICGGESGPRARACNLAWVRQVVRQCQAAQVACFVKQLGSHSVGSCTALDNPDAPVAWDARFHWRHKAGADPQEWPADLQVQQFPGEVRNGVIILPANRQGHTKPLTRGEMPA